MPIGNISKTNISDEHTSFDYGSNENNIYNVTKGNTLDDKDNDRKEKNMNDDYTHIDDGSNQPQPEHDIDLPPAIYAFVRFPQLSLIHI